MAANPGFECLVSGCIVEIPSASPDVQKMLLETHNRDVHNELVRPPVESSGAKSKKLQRLWLLEVKRLKNINLKF